MIACYDFIQALDKCHQKEYYKRIFGLCNNEKDALTKCLHDARLAGEREFILKRKEARKDLEKKWKQIDEEEYGEDAILKTILDRHYAKNKSAKDNE